MCLAIVKPASIVIPQAYLEHGCENNPDGAGFAVQHKGSVVIYKGFFTADDFFSAWEKHEHKSAVLHFRLASAGDISYKNCHPFQLVNGGALVHNGHFAGYDWHPQHSDTALWIATVLNPLLERYPTALRDPVLLALLESATQGSKVAILPRQGRTVVLHPDEWVANGGVLYSNKSYLPQPSYARCLGGREWRYRYDDAEDTPEEDGPDGFCPVCHLDPEDCTCYFRD